MLVGKRQFLGIALDEIDAVLEMMGDGAFAADVDAAGDFLETELRTGDVVLVKASYGAGLWRLGDRLTGPAVPPAGAVAAAVPGEPIR